MEDLKAVVHFYVDDGMGDVGGSGADVESNAV